MTTVTTLENGQIEVRKGNLTLLHTPMPNGTKFNECTVDHGEYVELVSSYDKRFKELFIELHNSRNL